MNRADRRKTAKVNKDEIQQRLEEGSKLLAAGNHGAAVQAFRSILNADPENPQALYSLGTVALMTGSAAQSESLFRRALVRNPRYLPCLNNLGMALHQLGRPKEAEQQLLSALAISETQADTLLNLARVKIDLGELDEAEDFAKRALSNDENRAPIHYALGLIAWLKEDFDKARSAFEKTVEINPLYKEAQYRLARLNHSEDDPSAWFKSFEKARSDHPEHDGVTQLYAEALFQSGENEKTVEILRDYNPQHPELQVHRCNLLSYSLTSLGNADEAVAFSKQALAIANDDPTTRKVFGRSLFSLGRHSEAKMQFQQAFDRLQLSQEFLHLMLLNQHYINVQEGKSNEGDHFIKEVNLDPPIGVSSVEEFSATLSQAMDVSNGNVIHPLDRMKRFGEKAIEGLFSANMEGDVEKLEKMVSKELEAYEADLNEQSGHPFAARKMFRTKAVKSHAMSASTFSDVVFPVDINGWISAYYFAEVPDICADDAAKNGWMNIGVLDFPFGGERLALKSVKPEVGKLVIFPTYLGVGFNELKAKSPLTVAVSNLDAVP